MPPTPRLAGASVSAAYRHLGVTRFEHHRDPGRVRQGGCERRLILGFGLWRGLMLDRLPVLGQPAPDPLHQLHRVAIERASGSVSETCWSGASWTVCCITFKACICWRRPAIFSFSRPDLASAISLSSRSAWSSALR